MRRVLWLAALLVLLPGMGDAQSPGIGYSPRPSQTMVLCVTAATVGNVDGGTDTLFTCTLPAGILAKDGDAIHITAAGTYAANTNSRVIELKFGSQAVISSVVNTTATYISWQIDHAIIVRTGASTQAVQAAYFHGNLGVSAAYGRTRQTATLSVDNSTAITVLITGTGVATNDITLQWALVTLVRA